MKANIDLSSFIGVFSDVYEEGYCKHLIEAFEHHQSIGAGGNRQSSSEGPCGAHKHIKDDYSIFCNGKNMRFDPFNEQSISKVFFDGLQQCFEIYTEQFSTLRDHVLSGTEFKMQKTSRGQGYHAWHSEQGNGHDNRVLVYMLYLNTIQDNSSETEFLYQQKRISPVENTMLIWPAGFTHAHRGNPVHGDTPKYAVTGWFELE